MNPDRIDDASKPPSAPWLLRAWQLKAAALQRLQETPESDRSRERSSGNWPPASVVEHLVLTEECVAGQWRAALEATPVARPGIGPEIASRMASFVMGSTSMRVPTVAGLDPKGGCGLAEHERRWETARARLEEALPANPRAAWRLHLAFGPLSSNQKGRLVVAHLRYHLRHWPTRTSS